ncbi:hypothetical protein JXB12_03935 [candidate division KSB1 bacterium]|nr:hypothetical protein [candidate division KSB1 bacterium]
MIRKTLELLIVLQDLDMMIEEISEVKRLGFNADGEDDLLQVREDLRHRIPVSLLYHYDRLKKRYKRAIVPVKDNICLGCLIKIPSGISASGRSDSEIYFCEGCGRILYWV